MSSARRSIDLNLSGPHRHHDRHYQVLTIKLDRPDRLITPADLSHVELPAGIDSTGGIVILGRAPIWLYSYLIHELHPTAWIACYDPRLGAVVVATHCRQVRIGEVIPISIGQQPAQLGAAVMVVGPPDSGKSVFSHALFQALLPVCPDVFLQRAHWDGEGNWILELPQETTAADRENFKLAYKGKLTERFFPYQGQAILQLRRQKPLVIVDVGGMVQPEKQPILEACSHYIIVSSKPEDVKKWHEFCRDRGNLLPLAVILSSLGRICRVHQYEPFLEMTCGPWTSRLCREVPDVLLEKAQCLVR